MKTMRLFVATAISIVCLAFAKQSVAQEAYVKGSIGYGLKSGTQSLPGFYNRTDGKVINREQIFVSFGKGLNAEGTFGYMFNNHVGGELGLSYLIGSKYTSRQESEDGSVEKELNAKMWRINPNIIISADPDNTIIPFAKFGLIVGKGSINSLSTYYDSDNGDIEIYKQKINGGIALGIKAGVGASYELSDQLSIFGELSMIGMSYGPKTSKIIEASANGEDILGELNTNEIEIEYVKDYVEQLNLSEEEQEEAKDHPTQQLRQKLPFGSIGINIGVRYSLSY